MSAFGGKRTSQEYAALSAFDPQADVALAMKDADISFIV
jgi:hypothetical protein